MEPQPMELDACPPYQDLQPVNTPENTVNLPSEKDLRGTSEALVFKLLSLSSPLMDKKIIDVLLLDGAYPAIKFAFDLDRH